MYGVLSGCLIVVGRLRFGPRICARPRVPGLLESAPPVATLLLVVSAADDFAARASRGIGLGVRVCVGILMVSLGILGLDVVRGTLPAIQHEHRLRLQARAALTYIDVAGPAERRLLYEWSDTLAANVTPYRQLWGVLRRHSVRETVTFTPRPHVVAGA